MGRVRQLWESPEGVDLHSEIFTVLGLTSIRLRARFARDWFLAKARFPRPGAVAAALGLGILVSAAGAQPAGSQAGQSAAIGGQVVDATGRPVEGATVRLQLSGSSVPVEVKSGAGGGFRASGLAAGAYTLTAESGQARAPSTVVTAAPGRESTVVLVVAAPGGPGAGSAQGSGFTDAMEFADKPSFTVAGVTDWTAAGGHGSDVNLRASEALVNETVRLKPGAGEKPAGPGPDKAAAMPAGAAHMAELNKKESDLRAAVSATPESFAANRNLAEFYAGQRRYAEALVPLQACYRIDAANRDNERDLVVALKETGDFAQARMHLNNLLAQGEDADLRRWSGEVDEALGDPLAAVREFEQAARLDPSEQNYFAWGSELLLHRAVLQAREVFSRGAEAYPGSVRMLTALGAALFAGAHYEEAAVRLCAASDLDPGDTEPYMFLGRIVVAAPNPLPCVVPKLARFAQWQPANPLANYYYAMALWKQDGQPVDETSAAGVEALLNKAVSVDAQCGEAWLQLGVLSYSRKEYDKAIGYFQKAIAADPQMSEAHYRLGMAYDRVDERDKAKLELDLHETIDREQKQEVEQQRRAIKQFEVQEPPQPPDQATKH